MPRRWGGQVGVGGAKETAAISSEAASIHAQAALRAKLSGLQKAQQTAAVTKTLPDGRIRYYTQEVPAQTEGATCGASFATEYNPATGSTSSGWRAMIIQEMSFEFTVKAMGSQLTRCTILLQVQSWRAGNNVFTN